MRLEWNNSQGCESVKWPTREHSQWLGFRSHRTELVCRARGTNNETVQIYHMAYFSYAFMNCVFDVKMVKSDPNDVIYFTLTKSVHFKVKDKILRINEIIKIPE